MGYRVGQIVNTKRWGPALVRQAVEGGTYVLDWWGVGSDDPHPRMHNEITTEDAITGSNEPPEELLALQVLVKGRQP